MGVPPPECERCVSRGNDGGASQMGRPRAGGDPRNRGAKDSRAADDGAQAKAAREASPFLILLQTSSVRPKLGGLAPDRVSLIVQAWVEGVAEAVTDEIDREDGHIDGEPREEDVPRR